MPIAEKQFSLIPFNVLACVLQVFLSVLLPMHAFPPCLAVLATDLRLICDPPPQDLEHFDHLPQEDHLQCSKKINEHFFTLRLCICFAYYTWTLSLITRFLPPFSS